MHPEDHNLYTKIVTQYVIQCYKCFIPDVHYCGDKIEAAEQFRNEGWKVSNGKVYCPVCVKKHKI